MNVKEIEKVVGNIQHQLFKNSNSYSVGAFKSSFKGSGLQFREHQVYTPGDDVRFIDWKLTAKTNKAFIKTFEEERNVEIVCIVDLTATMLLGYEKVSKLQASCEIVCLLFLLSQKTKDLVHVCFFFNDEMIELPNKSGREGIIYLISKLEKMHLMNEKGEFSRDLSLFKNELDEKNKLAVIKTFLAKRKEVVYLGDLSSYQENDQFNKFLARPNFHCFKIESPIDSSNSLPYSLLLKGSGETSKKWYDSFFMQQKRKKEPKNLKIKKIDISTRYLEQFIREMI
jgi:hypothetical protein